MSIFSSIKRVSAERGAQRSQAYRDLVADVAAGSSVDPTRAVDVLEAAGKSDDDLRRDSENFRQIEELRAKASRLGDLEEELKALGPELRKAEQNRDDAIAAAKLQYTEIADRERAVRGQMQRAKDAQAEINRLSLQFDRANPVDSPDVE